MEVNIQCQNILEGIEQLERYLQEKIAKEALDLDTNFETTRNQELLLRLKKSLLQYTERGKNLIYVGFMGHFSTGKSSTINSLLNLNEDSEEARRVGLNPVDKTITLITHHENKDSIFNTTKEGLVSIRASFISSEFLINIVVADTPGTGDPILASEIAQDFLPICDLIIYLFSAAIPLDSADVPLLSEKNSNLAFIPIRFVVTRADEFKKEHESPFSEENFDVSQANSFLGELSQRLNQLFSSSQYISSNNIVLINNKPQFHIEELRQIVEDFANSSNLDSRINIHSHKIFYFQSSAEKLKSFFCGFLFEKLKTLTGIIKVSQSNIERFTGKIRLTNYELTEYWNTQAELIQDKRLEIFKAISDLSEVPSSLNSLCVHATKANSIEYTWKTEANQRIELISEGIRRNLLPYLRENTNDRKRKVKNLTGLTKTLEDSEGFKLDFGTYSGDQLFADIDFLPSPLLSNQSLQLIREADTKIHERYREVKNAVETLKKILGEQKPIKDYQTLLNSAIDHLLHDFDAYFESITVYRSGVFALNVKEAISKLGLGHQMDVLESSELTELQKTIIKQEAQEHIFPEAYRVFSDVLGRLTDLQTRTEELQKRIGAAFSGSATMPSNVLEDWKNEQLTLIKNELLHDIHSNISKLQQTVNTRIKDLIVKHHGEWENEVDKMKIERRKRLINLTFSFGLGGLAVYLIYIFGVQKDLTNNIFVAFVFGIIVNLVSNVIGFIWAKITDRFPMSIKVKESAILNQFRDDYTQVIDDCLDSHDELINFDKMLFNEFWRKFLITEPLSLWSNSNESSYVKIKALAEDYNSLRHQYLEIVDEAAELASHYFTDTDSNLEKLNEFLDKLQATAIKPSFDLLAETKEKLDTVIKSIQEIDFA